MLRNPVGNVWWKTSVLFSFLAEMLERLQETAGDCASNSTRPSRRSGLYYPGGILSVPEEGQLQTVLEYCDCCLVL